MSTTLVVALVAVTLLVVSFVVFAQAISFFLIAIAFSGLLYRYAEERYPEVAGIASGATGGIRNPPPEVSPERPLADLDNDPDEDLEAEPEITDDEWLYANL